jgi:hypothetical protein
LQYFSVKGGQGSSIPELDELLELEDCAEELETSDEELELDPEELESPPDPLLKTDVEGSELQAEKTPNKHVAINPKTNL